MKGPWGVVTATSGPQEPPASRHPDLQRADALLRRGMVALDKSRPRRLDEAEGCFRRALDLLEGVLDEPHPRISYALDRIGLVCHLQDRLEEAEALYLRSLKILREGEKPSRWVYRPDAAAPSVIEVLVNMDA
ncbi:MAG: tetratricopeptide repeat protein [Gemmatimonadota bacterium]